MNRHRLETHLYVLRDHLGLTRAELQGLLLLGGLLLGGLILHQVRQRLPALDPATYIQLEEEFRRRSWQRPDPEPIGPVLPLPPDPVPTVAASAGAVNLNTADSDQLQELPRIGPKTAQRILAFRESHGPFRTVDDLLMISGIGPATLERLRPLVTVVPVREPE